jgi:hypothetical protein
MDMVEPSRDIRVRQAHTKRIDKLRQNGWMSRVKMDGRVELRQNGWPSQVETKLIDELERTDARGPSRDPQCPSQHEPQLDP